MFTRKLTSRFGVHQRRAKFLFIISIFSALLFLCYCVQYVPTYVSPLSGDDELETIQDRLVIQQEQIELEPDGPILQVVQAYLEAKQELFENEIDDYVDEQQLLEEEESQDTSQKLFVEKELPPLIETPLLKDDLPLLEVEQSLLEETLPQHIDQDPGLELDSYTVRNQSSTSIVTKEQSQVTQHTLPIIKIPVTQQNLDKKVNSSSTQAQKDTNTTPKPLKYILLWTNKESFPLNYFREGQKAFLSNKNCSSTNCYVTTDRDFLDGDLTKFDAIVFNGRNVRFADLPRNRSLHQKYIFVNTESADRFPVCDSRYEDFYNWTATYRLDSDIPFTYILIKDNMGNIVGPKRNMTWLKDKPKVGNEFTDSIKNKTKAAAWFVSHCETRSGRENFVKELQEALKVHGHTVDVYGSCGTMNCPRGNESVCDRMLESEYFFYMSLENSFDEDYVTEKLLRTMQQNIVPIVYGGADYSRFLPPGSYINGRDYSVPQLAAFMYKLMNSPGDYRQYFWWKPFYTYQRPQFRDSVCAVCEALSSGKAQEISMFTNFRKLWHPNYEERCLTDDKK